MMNSSGGMGRRREGRPHRPSTPKAQHDRQHQHDKHHNTTHDTKRLGGRRSRWTAF